MKQTLTKRPDRGFTLIELLVVIAIIAVLAALILAALSSAQKGARDSQRKSDASQYQKALIQYYNAQSPVRYPGTGATGTTVYPTQEVTSNSTEPCASIVTTYMSSCLDEKKTGHTEYFYGANANNFRFCVVLEKVATATIETWNVNATGAELRNGCNMPLT